MVQITGTLLLASKARRCPLTRMEAREGVTNMGILGAVIIDTVEVDNILKCQQLMSTEDKGLISLEPSMPQRPGSSAKKKKNRTCLVKKEARNKEL